MNRLILLYWVGMVLLACEPMQPAMTYVDELEKHRQEMNQYMNEAEDSPFSATDSVIMLSYFPVNERYKVIANITRIENGNEVTLATSDGVPRVYSKHAILSFELDNQPYQLLVLKGDEDQGLFLAFADKTNDVSTYGGGRYVNLSFSEQAQKITLDFNKAYNPYCEYNPEYSCPLPPLENYLSVAIEAGEKKYKD